MANILIVEDENIVALNLKRTLESLGYKVVSMVKSGEEAIKKINENPPDLVLMDIRLKGIIDGIETAESIMNDFNLPIVFLTALSDEKTLDRAANIKPYGYLVKPFTKEDIHTAVESALLNFEESLKENNLNTKLSSLP